VNLRNLIPHSQWYEETKRAVAITDAVIIDAVKIVIQMLSFYFTKSTATGTTRGIVRRHYFMS
jgi:hypothetical protein